MRALTTDFDAIAPTDSFLGVLDQFAALRSYASAPPAVGGYRMLAATRPYERRPLRRIMPSPATLAALSRARLRLTGVLSVMLVGGLGLAVLAGPATCACSLDAASKEQISLMRLSYADNGRFADAHASLDQPAEPLASLGAATLLEPELAAPGVSSITTSALEPAGEALRAKREAPGLVGAPRLPSEIVPVADTGPPVRLAAAANIATDAVETLPAIEVQTPPLHKLRASEVEAEDEDDSAGARHIRAHRRVTRAYRTPTAKPVRAGGNARNPMLVQRAPRWAQQMYVTPWQSQAFSYTR